MKETFAGRIRQAGIEQDGREFSVNDIVSSIGIQTRAEKKKVWESIRDFVRFGEWERVGKGRYRVSGKPRTVKPVEKRVVMWRYMRMKRQRGDFFTLDDLVEVSGSGREWAGEWVAALVKHGSVRDYGNGKYRLVSVNLDMPLIDEKAAKLRELRQRRRDAIKEAVERGRQMLSCIAEAIDVDSQMDMEA